MSVTKSKLQLWENVFAYQLCYLCVHDKSANAGTTLLGVLMCSKVKPPHLKTEGGVQINPDFCA